MHGVAVADGVPAFIERLAPIQADHIRAGRGHLREQACRLHAKVDHRHAHLLDGTHEALRGLEGVLAIIGQAERTDPTVKNLDHVRPSIDLQAAILRQHNHDLVQKAAPRSGVRVHHLLGVDVIL